MPTLLPSSSRRHLTSRDKHVENTGSPAWPSQALSRLTWLPLSLHHISLSRVALRRRDRPCQGVWVHKEVRAGAPSGVRTCQTDCVLHFWRFHPPRFQLYELRGFGFSSKAQVHCFSDFSLQLLAYIFLDPCKMDSTV